MINDEVSNKIIAVTFDSMKKIPEESLAAALQKLSELFEKEKSLKSIREYTGKQPIKQLLSSKSSLSSIKIDSTNIKGFDQYAKKYGVDYSLVKDKGTDKYTVFFRAKDIDVLNHAFKEFAKDKLTQKSKESVRKKLQTMIAKVKSIQKVIKPLKKNKEQER